MKTPSSSLAQRLWACLSLFLATVTLGIAVPAFPGAEGFGANAVGGRGGQVYVVNNLNDSGPGSFRDAVSQPNRTVVFAVGGVIRISSRISVASNVTIAGQTAPGEGITIYGNGMSFSNANNSVTRYLRIRMGVVGDSGKDALGIAEGHDMIFDHVSVSWGRDETFSVSGSVQNITIQDCIIAQGLQSHSAGGLIQTDGGVSILRTLYIDNFTRNPKVKGVNDFVNNVVYNWGGGGAYILGDSAGQSYANIVNNLFIDGPNTTIAPFIRGNLNFHVYAAGNYQDGNRNGTLEPRLILPNEYTTVDFQSVRYPYPEVGYLFSAEQTYDYVARHAGASLARDRVDRHLIDSLRSLGTSGEIISNENDAPMFGTGPVAGGVAPADRDADGMPDSWEAALGLNPDVQDHNADLDSNGYTNLEDYLNALAAGGVQRVSVERITPDTGRSSSDAITSSQTITLHGTATPGSIVTVRRVSAGTGGQAVADGAGVWTLDLSASPLAEGLHAFTATASEPSGHVSAPSRALFVRVDTAAPAAPAITSVSQNTTVQVNGSGEPGASIEVTLQGAGVIGEIQVDDFGFWTLTSNHPALSAGVFQFAANTADLAGNAGPASAPFVLDASLTAPTITGISADAGSSSTDFITNDATLVLTGTAANGAVVEVTRLGAGILGTATADGAGVWNFDYTSTTLPAGLYQFSATAKSESGTSLASPSVQVRLDLQKPVVSAVLRQAPQTSATIAGDLVYRVVFSEDVTGVDLSDFSITATGVTGTLGGVTSVDSKTYDVTVNGATGEGTIRVDLKSANTGIADIAGNLIGAGYTAGQNFTIRLPGSGVWLVAESGSWTDAASWENGAIANGAGATADFSAVDLEETIVVSASTPRTIGHLVFGDTDVTSAAGWELAGSEPLNLVVASGAPTITVNPLGTGAVVRILPALVSASGLTKLGTGVAVLTKPNDIQGNLAVTRGALVLSETATLRVADVTTGNAGSQLRIEGGDFRASGLTTITAGGSSGVHVSAGVAEFAGGIVSTNARDALVRVSGGLLKTPRIEFPRTNDGSINFAVGLVVAGGRAEVGTVRIGTVNSWGTMSVEGGSLTVAGPVVVGEQVTSGRGGRMRVTSGTFNVQDGDLGLVLARNPGTQPNNVASAEFTGGVSTLQKVTLGFDATSTAGSATLTVNGGTVYLGAGGVVANGTGSFVANVAFTRGVVGAAQSWTTSVPVQFASGGDVTLQTADAAGGAQNIALLGGVGGSGILRKTGSGTLVLGGQSSFAGNIVVLEGALRSTAAQATAGNVSLEAGSSLALGLGTNGTSERLVVGGSLTKSGSGPVTVRLTPDGTLAVGQTYTLATYGSTNLTPADLVAIGLPAGLTAVFTGEPTALKATLVGPPVISSAGTATGKVAEAFEYTIAASNSPSTFSASGLPEGLQINPTTGVINGTPLQAGTFTVTLRATNGAGSGELVLTLTVQKGSATVTLGTLWFAYDGSTKAVAVNTVPADLEVKVEYNGSSELPIWPGKYTVTAVVDDPDFTGETGGILEIVPTAIVRNAPILNGDIDGSVQVLLPQNVTFNRDAGVTGDLLLPGTPQVRVNGQPTFAGVRSANGATQPTNHIVTLNTGALLRNLVQRLDATPLGTVQAPRTPSGTRSVTLNRASDPVGDFATLRDLTVNGAVGVVKVPAGSYGHFTVNSGNTFEFGSVGSTTPTVYEFNRLSLNGSVKVRLVGPVIVRLGSGLSFNGNVGSSGQPQWLRLEIASGDLTLNTGAELSGVVIAPQGRVTINSAARIIGRIESNHLTLNGTGLLREVSP